MNERQGVYQCTNSRNSPESDRRNVNQLCPAGWPMSYSTDLLPSTAVSKRAWNRECWAPLEFRDRGRNPCASVRIISLLTRRLIPTLRHPMFVADQRQSVGLGVRHQQNPAQREEVVLHGPSLVERGSPKARYWKRSKIERRTTAGAATGFRIARWIAVISWRTAKSIQVFL